MRHLVWFGDKRLNNKFSCINISGPLNIKISVVVWLINSCAVMKKKKKKKLCQYYGCWYSSLLHCCNINSHGLNTLRPRQDGRHFPDDIFKWIFLNENAWISINISLKFVPRGPINNIPTLVQVMAWRRPGDKPLSEPMMVRLPTHICVTRPQWVKYVGWIN